MHVCVVAGKHLVSADENGLSDPYVHVALDNSPASVFNSRSNRTKTARRTLNPVWGGGRGETFTFVRAPGAAEVQLRVWDADGGLQRSQFLGIATVPLFEAPADGSWSDTLTVSLFPDGPSQEAATQRAVHGAPRRSRRRRVAVAKDESGGGRRFDSRRGRELEFWPDPRAPRPAPDAGPYVNKVTSSTFVYFQICGTRDLPTYRRGPEETTNVKATIALNSDRHVHHTAVQAEVLKDAVWMPEVCSFPRNPNSSTVTVRVYGNLTKLWDPTVMTDMARDVTMGLVDRGADGDKKNDKKKSSRYSQSKAKTTRGVEPLAPGFGPDLNKKHFALGTLIGEVKIPVAALTPGDTADPRWLPIAPVRSDDDKVPSWLAPYGDRLGEICVAAGAGFLREAPTDLVNPSDHWVLPTLGELEVRVLEVVGDPPPKDIASSWFGWGKHEDSVTGAGSAETENMLASGDVSVQLLWEGRAEKVATPHEHRSFGVTDPASELRVLVLAEGPLALDEVLLGAAVLPVRDVIDASRVNATGTTTGRPGGRDVVGRHRPAQDAPVVGHVRRELPDEGAQERRPRGWRGRVRVSVELVPKRAPCTAGTCGRCPGPAGRRTWTTRSKGWWRRRRDWSPLCSRPSPRRSPPWRTLSPGVAGTQQRVDRVAHRAVPVRSEARAVGVFPPVVRERGVFRGVRVRPGEGRVRRSGDVHGPQGVADHVGPRGSRLGAAFGVVVVVGTGGVFVGGISSPVSNGASVSNSPVSNGGSVSKGSGSWSRRLGSVGSSWSRRFGSSRSSSSRTDDGSARGVKDQKTLRKKLIEEEERIWKRRSAGSSETNPDSRLSTPGLRTIRVWLRRSSRRR